jgi:hypothetical protein
VKYTIDDAIKTATERAARDREGSFAVYRDGEDILVRDARALAPPRARLECIAQFWGETEGRIMVQLRYARGESAWREIIPDATTADVITDADTRRWRIVNTWNGGAGGRVVVHTSSATGHAGYDECMKWIHTNTSFSFHQAITYQGYKLELE